MTTAARQLPLPLAAPPSFAAADFVPDRSNEAALAWVARPDRWPAGRLALAGPAGVGKTHLLHAFAPDFRHLAGPALTEALALAPPVPTAIDDGDAAPEAALFHLVNRCAEAGVPLLMAARTPPARWPAVLPDLASRLRATASVALAEPSDQLLAALLAKHLADRQLPCPPPVAAFLLARLPRRAEALAAAVAALDAAALAARAPLTRPFCARVLGWQEKPG
jgi:chromosomal replication initiation ATPase DnaA